MAERERLICASGALADSGRGVRFEVEYDGRLTPAFAVRYGLLEELAVARYAKAM